VRTSAVVGIDETGLRQDGVRGYVWLARTDTVSLFRAELSRGAWVAVAMLGKGFAGVLLSDFYGAYTAQTQGQHGYCGAHLTRDAKALAELVPCTPTAEFRERLAAFYIAGKAAQANGEPAAIKGTRVRFGHRIGSANFVGVLDLVRLQERMAERREGIELVLTRPDVPATNNATERDLRDDARYRAMTGGTRSRQGSEVLAHWMSITQTRRKNGLALGPFVHGVLQAHLSGKPPPSVFAD
jgi:transposase